FGAEVAAFGFEFLGVSCLLVPFFLTVMGWRRLRRRGGPRVVGRGFGALLVLAALPGLLHLSAGRIPWREGSVLSGGAFGKILSEVLETRLNFGGTSVVLVALVVIGSALVIQSTLGDLMAAWKARIAGWLEESRLARERRRERREKEKARRRVITKHLQRVVEEKKEKQQREAQVVPLKGEPVAGVAGSRAVRAAEAPAGARGGMEIDEAEAPSPYGDRLDLPLRVTERRGEGEFAVRRVRGSQPAAPQPSDDGDDDFWEQREAAAAAPMASAGEMPAARAAAPRTPRPVPQKDLPFTGDVRPGELPPVNLLQLADHRTAVDGNELVRLGETIRSRCAEFGVDGSVEGISPGPVITVYEFQPAPGVKVSQIVNLQDDLALALKAESVRIDRMPGRSTLGIEVPNRERGIIRLGNLMADERFRKAPSVLTMALGTNIHGEPYYADLATMPHLLVAGATGAGKSVGLQSMITSILYKATREEVQFIFIDPKRIELGVYADIPHLKAEVVVDPKKAANALRWAVAEMERRYRLLAEVHVRSIGYYNRAIQDPEVQQRLSLTESDTPVTASDLKPMPYYVVVIDELADLMMVSSAEVETSIARLAQMARAVGIHLIIATQRPSVDVLTGTIKANFPCRISFATASRHDSRTILDQVGSEKLLGKGDMLMMPPGTSRIMRLHGAYISEQETAALVRWLKKQGKPELDPDVLRNPDGDGAGSGDGGDNDDDLYDQAARLVVAERQASASFLQRRMRVGFSRAARLIDMMERDGLLGPPQGSKPREVLVKPDYFLEVDEGRGEE
ncbi:MAG TPA: DNA translocase FtsK 4TM domain-containing protein, partial [Thermoanaerobaculia bacterium]|nr:DNA translocase FtsK 4TM domain-containing protein [Thermoanaerobaculia bacterium]